MPDGGRLTIETANVHVDPAYTSRRQGEGVDPGDYVAIGVSDTGSGMPGDVVAKAIDPFFTKPVGAGTGPGPWAFDDLCVRQDRPVAIFASIARWDMARPSSFPTCLALFGRD